MSKDDTRRLRSCIEMLDPQAAELSQDHVIIPSRDRKDAVATRTERHCQKLYAHHPVLHPEGAPDCSHG